MELGQILLSQARGIVKNADWTIQSYTRKSSADRIRRMNQFVLDRRTAGTGDPVFPLESARSHIVVVRGSPMDRQEQPAAVLPVTQWSRKGTR